MFDVLDVLLLVSVLDVLLRVSVLDVLLLSWCSPDTFE